MAGRSGGLAASGGILLWASCVLLWLESAQCGAAAPASAGIGGTQSWGWLGPFSNLLN